MSASKKTTAVKKRESVSGYDPDIRMDYGYDDHSVDSNTPEHRKRYRQTRNQGSSSFRLGSGTNVAQRSSSNAVAQPNQPPTSRQAAKRPSNESELSVRKRSSQRHGGQYRLSSSTLATGSSVGNRPATPSTSRDSEPARSSTPLDPGPSSSPNAIRSQEPAMVGLATDPAQIVNLALSLSESRRLQNGRVASGVIPRDRRLSTALHSRSPIPDGRSSPFRLDDRQPTNQPYNDTLHSPAPFLDHGDQEFNFSELSTGTIARVEKARQHFELFTEYLRLLSRLPPLTPSTAGSIKHSDSSVITKPVTQGRQYNPLQYIRNRKVRYRERAAINSEEEGWEDVDKVRNWIDGVVTAIKDKEYDGDECIQLPPLQASGQVIEEVQENFSSPGRTNTNDTSKPRRPRMDWVMTPSDLLADVAWVETGKNKLKLEDREGRKLFPADTNFKPVHLTKDAPSPDLLPVEHSYNPLYSEGRLPSVTSIGSRESSKHHRGRRIHKFTNSIHLTPDHGAGHSRAGSKSGWRKALSRSKSPSGLSHSDEDERQSFENISKPDSSAQQKTVRALLPPLDPVVRDPKQRSYDYAGSFSSLDDYTSNTISRPSFDEADSAQQSPSKKMMFPSITANLSTSLSRESSPSTRHPLSIRTSLDRSIKTPQKADTMQGISPRVVTSVGAIPDMGPNQLESPVSETSKPQFLEQTRVLSQEDKHTDSSPRNNLKNVKIAKGADGKRRGIFKGGRIAELVGNEVSKVGDKIRSKDHSGHSRQSSSASASSVSEFVDAEDGMRRKTKPRLGRIPTQSDAGSVTQTDQAEVSKYHIPNLPVFTSSIKPNDPREESALSLEQSESRSQRPIQPEVHDQEQQADDPSQTSKKNTDISISQRGDEAAINHESRCAEPRPNLYQLTRNWSLSSRSIPKYSCYYRVDKREILRVRAHLISTGVKAQEICRHANPGSSATFNPLSGTLSDDSHNPLPYIGNQELASAATKRLVSALDESVQQVHSSISKFTVSDFPSFTSDLERLDRLITASLHSRLREVSNEAEYLTGQLATTSTLAIKQLNDALDKGIRKRRRRFRWVSRFGYVLLEWVLVGVMWWVWTIVMLWKLLRGIWRGTISGIRWVLWL